MTAKASLEKRSERRMARLLAELSLLSRHDAPFDEFNRVPAGAGAAPPKQAGVPRLRKYGAPRAGARGGGAVGSPMWEYGADRAFQFAKRERDRGRVKRPTVVGALINWYLDFAAANTDKVYDTVRCAFIEGDLLYSLRSRRPVANGVGPAIARVSVGERHDARPWPGGRA